MSRIYAKVSIEMWGDEKFTQLSPLRPSSQALWIYLLTGRFRTSIPGLNLNVGIGALSDRLGWKSRDVECCWGEIADRQMAEADWRHGVVWLPKGIEHNEPESPNVIKGWGKLVLPECDLVSRALGSLQQYLSTHLSEAYSKAFRDTFSQGSSNQEQELDQDQYPHTPAARGPKASTRKPTTAEQKRADDYLRAIGGCKHDPKCDTYDVCVGKLVYTWRHNKLVGMLEEAAS